jgi:adenylate cyclase
MIKFTIFLLLTSLSLFAKEATDAQLQGIYTEALLFVGIFGTMGVISYIYSSRHAKSHTLSEDEKKRMKNKKREHAKKEERVEELSTMLQKNLIREEEFTLLKHYYTKESDS